MERQSARERLLDAVVGHFARDGLGDQSLRRIALAVGTSHRMLLYHFGSRDGLLLAVAQRVEARTRGVVEAMGDAVEGGTDELIRGVWAHVSDPGLADFERLFFALYGRALQGDPALVPLLESDVATWLDTNAAVAEAARPEMAPETARVPRAWAWRSCAACYSTSWRRENGPRSMRRWRPSPPATRAPGGDRDAQPTRTSDRAS